MPTTAEQVVAYARAQIGDPYVWGGEGEYDGSPGYDCSGLIYAAYKSAGLNVSRTTAAVLGRQGTAVSRENAVPGDVVYYDNPGPTDHVGIYVGSGYMIDAPTFGKPVAVRPIRNPTSIRRLPGIAGGSSGGGITYTPDGVPIPAGTQTEPTDGSVSGGLLDSLNPVTAVTELLEGWQGDLVTIGLKITAGLVVGGLFIVGAREAFAERGRA